MSFYSLEKVNLSVTLVAVSPPLYLVCCSVKKTNVEEINPKIVAATVDESQDSVQNNHMHQNNNLPLNFFHLTFRFLFKPFRFHHTAFDSLCYCHQMQHIFFILIKLTSRTLTDTPHCLRNTVLHVPANSDSFALLLRTAASLK